MGPMTIVVQLMYSWIVMAAYIAHRVRLHEFSVSPVAPKLERVDLVVRGGLHPCVRIVDHQLMSRPNILHAPLGFDLGPSLSN